MTAEIFIQKDKLITDQIYDYESDVLAHEIEITANKRKIAELMYKRRELAHEYLLSGGNATILDE